QARCSQSGGRQQRGSTDCQDRDQRRTHPSLRQRTILPWWHGHFSKATARHDHSRGVLSSTLSVDTISIPKPARPTEVSFAEVSKRIEVMLKSLRIWAPSPTSRHCRERATSEPVEPGCGMACVGTPAAPSRKKTMTPRPSCLKRCNEESIEFPPPNTS